jgi:hypothetical protein
LFFNANNKLQDLIRIGYPAKPVPDDLQSKLDMLLSFSFDTIFRYDHLETGEPPILCLLVIQGDHRITLSTTNTLQKRVSDLAGYSRF